MNKCISRRIATSLLMLGLLALAMTACRPLNSQEAAALEWRHGLAERLQHNLSEPFSGRVQAMPPDMFKDMQNSDRSIGIESSAHYIARIPAAKELALIKLYFELLPRAHQEVFSRKVLAVYLVDGFAGAGLTEWLVDREGNTYYYMVLNSLLLTESLDDWLSYKESSPFDKSAVSPTIRVRTKTGYKALLYGLLHEGTHVVDYELGIAPSFDRLHQRLIGRAQGKPAFTQGIWLERMQPVAQYDFQHRGEINLYGIYAKKSLIPRSELSVMFSQLAKTPFVSFYSGTSWNEDLADYLTYHHIEKNLGGAVTVELLNDGKVVDLYEPVKTPLAKQREESVKVFHE